MWRPYMQTKHWGWLFDKLVMYLTPEERKQLAVGIKRERMNYFLLGVLVNAIVTVCLLMLFKWGIL